MPGKLPKISIITIVKDNEKLLPCAIRSVLSQNFYNFEYIIINDGSIDQTHEIIRSFTLTEPRIKSIDLQPNRGRSYARNIGLNSAKGEFILFLDSDDYLPSYSLFNLIEIAEFYDSDIVYGGFRCFDQYNGKLNPYHYTYEIINHEKHGFSINDYPVLVNNHHIVGRLYRKSFIKQKNIQFNEFRKNGEDVLFSFFTSFYAEKISMVPDRIVYNYRIGRYIAAATESKILDSRDNILDTLKFVNKNGSRILRRAMNIKCHYYLFDLERACHVYRNNRKKILKYLSSFSEFINEFDETIIKQAPWHIRLYINALKIGDFKKAYKIYRKHYNKYTYKDQIKLIMDGLENQGYSHEKQSIVDNLIEENKRLQEQLNALKASMSWKITAPLRLLITKMKLKRKVFEFKKEALEYHANSGINILSTKDNEQFGIHRSGWNYAISTLRKFHHSDGIFIVKYLEELFCWKEEIPHELRKIWIGFSHRPPNIPNWYPRNNKKQFYQSKLFKMASKTCVGIFTLSEYHAMHLRNQLPITIESLIHPTEIPKILWNPLSLEQSKKKVVQVGWWLRKLHAIFMLPKGNYKKIYLNKGSREYFIYNIFNLEANYLVKNRIYSQVDLDSVETINFLSNRQYDHLLSECIIFLDLYDASANNTIVEAIARTTPIIVNPLEAVIEYLGPDYPLYYSTYEEAAEKIENNHLIYAAHEYLKKCKTRKKLKGEYFAESFFKSTIYNNLLRNKNIC